MKRKVNPVSAITKGLGDRLRKAREERGLSQKHLADMINAEVMQISRYERGRVIPALETAIALADVLRVSADTLLMGREEDQPPQTPTVSDLRLHERFLEAERLSRQDREAIILLIDGVLAQRDLESRIEKRRRA